MSARSDALAAQLAVLKSKAERREAIRHFEAGQMPTEDVRDLVAFRSWLQAPGESRAMSEGTASAGGNAVPTRWYGALVRQMLEFNGIVRAFEVWETATGNAYDRAIAAVPQAGVAQTEGSTWSDNTYLSLTQQAWGRTPLYAASIIVSNQMMMDATDNQDVAPSGSGWDVSPPGGEGSLPPVINGVQNASLEGKLAGLLGTALGRVVAPVGATALYASITGVGATSGMDGGFVGLTAATPVTYSSGATTELAANTINLDTAAQMIASLDPAYLDSASFYFSQSQWAGLRRQVDAQKHIQIDPGLDHTLYGFPVAITSGVTAAAASTVSGPVFGNLGVAMTMRIGGGLQLFKSSERFADSLQTYFRASTRVDFEPQDNRAVVGVKYAAT
jgi:hypothetical protein